MRSLRRFLGGRLFASALVLLLFAAAVAALAIALPKALAPIALAERLFSLGVGLYVAGAPMSCEGKTVRLLLLLLLPYLGAVLSLLGRRTSLPPSPSEPSLQGGLMRAAETLALRGCGLSGSTADSAEYFPTGKEMHERLIADLKGAEREILLDYYILARGVFFDSVLSVLTEKAQTIDVKLIYDDFGCATRLPRNFSKELARRGIETTVFHPVRPFPFGKLNRRDHRKIAVIDRKIAYTGGINLADEYIGERICYGHWKDTAVRLTGAAAERFAALFAGRSCVCPPQKGIPCVVFGDGAERGARIGEDILCRLIAASGSSLFVNTPYLVPTERIFSALAASARAGVDVRIMIPHIPDKKCVFLLSRDCARQLARFGVKVREYAPGFLHAKSVASDGRYALVGSYNLDARSLRMQAECAVLAESESLCAALTRDFSACWETGVPVPKATAKERLLCFFLRPFSPLI